MTGSTLFPTAAMMTQIRVLIVEDEYILAVNLQEALVTFGYTVVGIVDSSEAALAAAIALRPQIILMDIRIRGEQDGIQTAEKIWHNWQIPVIYVTGHSDQSTVERATLTAPFGYILKPVREKELYVAIQTAVSRYGREQFFTKILQSMGDGVIVVDPQLRIKYLNTAAELLIGCRFDEVKEQIVTDVTTFLDQQSQAIPHPLQLVLQTEATIHIDEAAFLICNDGVALPVADSAALLRDYDGTITGAVLVFRDDTQRRLLEERDRAQERAQQSELRLAEQQRLNQLKDDFLATTSHELRTPLSNIRLAICLLETILNQQNSLNKENKHQAELVNHYLTILRDQCEQELQLVNDLLDLRSLDAGIYPLVITSVHLQDWLPHLVESFQDRLQQHNQSLQIVVPPDLPALETDLPSLTRVLSELLNNACKYTPATQAIEIRATLVTTAVSPRIQVQIRNAGVTIAPDHQARIFDRFYRIPNDDPWKYGGTGLGLALLKRLVEQLQGTVTVTSDVTWTTFTVDLPLVLMVPEGL